jgi:hypothetical protein
MVTNSLLVSSNYKSTLDHSFSFITDEMRMLEVYGCYRLEGIFQLTLLILWLNAVLLRLLLLTNE